MHKGRSLLVRLEVQSIEPTERMTNYFFGYVVKEMRNAYENLGESLTEAQTYDTIRANSPAIAWIQRWASMEFGWIIDDPV